MQEEAVDVVLTDDVARWDAALAASGVPLSAFHRLPWIHEMARLTGERVHALVVRSGGRDVGVVPWVFRRRGPFSTVNWVPYPYSGPVVPPHLLGATLDALRSRRRTVVVEQHCFIPGVEIDRSALERRGFALHEDSTYVVDTTRSVDELWAAVESRTRRAVRKTLKLGITLEPATDLRVLSEVLRQVFARQGITSGYSNDLPTPDRLSQALQAEVHARVAYLGDEPIGSLVQIRDGETACTWAGGVLPAHRETYANTRLYWDAVEWAASSGVRSLDLVGVPTDGIGTFKSQFSSERRGYVVAERTHPLWRAGRDRLLPLLTRRAAAVPAA